MTNIENWCFLGLYKNGIQSSLNAFSEGGSANRDSGSMSVVLELVTGDRIWVQNGGCQFLYGSYLTSFSGCRI